MQPCCKQDTSGLQGGCSGGAAASRPPRLLHYFRPAFSSRSQWAARSSSRETSEQQSRSAVLCMAQPQPQQQSSQSPIGLLGWLLPSWAWGARRNAASASSASSRTDSKQQPQWHTGQGGLSTAPTHLIIMVNGLFGSSSNWDVICEQLQQHLPPDTLLHPSKVNARFSTYQGIDACGQRLADEVRGVVAQAGPSLTRISVIAHSMGGLMARYALGTLYNPSNGTVCGLQPAHFISMATPHCGCDADGVAQVPFIGWTGDIPLLGQQLYRFLQGISGSTASIIFQRTGQQFFLLDGTAAAAAAAAAADASTPTSPASLAAGAAEPAGDDPGSTTQLPLLLQMTQDCPDRGLYFYSALAAFKTRTAYANMDGDHLVGFANSSLRSLEQLPPAPPEAATAKGVVLEDSLSAGFWPHDWSTLQQQWVGSSSSAAVPAVVAPGGSQGSTQPAEEATAAVAAVKRPYLASRDWTFVSQQQRAAARLKQGSPDSAWHELSSSSRVAGDRTPKAAARQQQQQQVEEEHPASLLAALELEAGGAAFAATAAVAGGVRQQQQVSAIVPAAGAAAATSSSDSGDELLDLQYSSPLSTASPSQQSPMSSTDLLEPSSPQQQQQKQQGAVSVGPISSGSATSAAKGAAAVASAEADLTSGLSGAGGGPVLVADSPAAAAAGVAADAAQLMGDDDAVGSRAEVVGHMLRRLQELPWRRIDVSFQGAKFGFAHNNIQVTRRWWNFEGVAVPAHLAQQLQLMDTLVLGPEQQQQQQQACA